MRIKNLYNPPTMKDRDWITPWCPDGTHASSKTTDEGCEITFTGKASGWLYPPQPLPDGLANVVWQEKDGSYLIGIYNMTVPISEGNLITMLRRAGLPLVFAATDHPY